MDEILKANKNLAADTLARLRALYAKDVLHKLAEKGWWVEIDGVWKQK